jgi:hypothetical protein
VTRQRIDPIRRGPVPAAVDRLDAIQPVRRREPRPEDEQPEPRREPQRPPAPDDGLPHVDVVV